jgi:hypothetical protein
VGSEDRIVIGMFYENGDRVKVDDCGQYHLATVVRDDRWEHGFLQTPCPKVWIRLDGHDNPIWATPDELELV